MSRGLLVVVVAYRSDDLLPAALGGIAGLDTVVVDNASGDSAAGDAAAAADTRTITEDAGARYVAAPRNLGFAAGVNLGLDTAWDGRSDVLLLNPDAVTDAATVRRLQAEMHRPGRRLAAVAPRLLDRSGREQRVRWPLPSPGQLWCEALGGARWWRGPDFVIGAVLLLNGDALATVGRFDERYFLYAEETDWQLRARRAGWTSGLVADAIAVHVGAASSSDPERREQLFHAAAEVFARRWYGGAGWQAWRAAAVLAALRRILTGGRSARGAHARTALRYLRGPLREARRHGALP